MRKNYGSINIVCIIIVIVIAAVIPFIITLTTQDYYNVNDYMQEQQALQLSLDGIKVLQNFSDKSNKENIKIELTEQLPPAITAKVQLNITNDNNVQWMSSKTSIKDLKIQAVQAIAGYPDSENKIYKYTIASKDIIIKENVQFNKDEVVLYPDSGCKFINFLISDYARYSFLLPDANTMASGLGANIYYNNDLSGFNMPSRIVALGDAIIVCRGDINIGAGCVLPGNIQLISMGNINIAAGADFDNVFLLAAKNIKLADNVKLKGKIFAKQTVTLGNNSIIEACNMSGFFITDVYLK